MNSLEYGVLVSYIRTRYDAQPTVQPFPGSFWTANVTELFERAAYYSMASFVVIYLGQLGFGAYWPSFLNSTVLWGLVYFLPILSGTIADQIGFRRALLAAFVLLAIGSHVAVAMGLVTTGLILTLDGDNDTWSITLYTAATNKASVIQRFRPPSLR